MAHYSGIILIIVTRTFEYVVNAFDTMNTALCFSLSELLISRISTESSVVQVLVSCTLLQNIKI